MADLYRNPGVEMDNDDPRKAYWNDKYVEYWRARVAEAGAGESGVVQGDSRTEGDGVYEQVFAATPFRSGCLLDVGCAWGRMFSVFHKHALRVSGIDISAAMVDAAREQWGTAEWVDRIEESSAEMLPFADRSFDNLVCLATFDATYQHLAMSEFLRVTRPGGRIYVTGKHDHYSKDDAQALAAEIGARRKGHPNHFTDTSALIRQMSDQGHVLLASYYFPRRGDFAAWRHTRVPGDRFYEYFLVFERGKDWRPLQIYADTHSRTFREQELQE